MYTLIVCIPAIWGQLPVLFLRSSIQTKQEGFTILYSHWCLLHHLALAVGRVALKPLWLCGVFCSGFIAIFLVNWGFIMK